MFLALDDIGPASLEGLLGGRMSTYRIVYTPTVGDCHEAGFRLLPTFHRPHYTLGLTSGTEAEVSRLLAALGEARDNPYHGGLQRGGR